MSKITTRTIFLHYWKCNRALFASNPLNRKVKCMSTKIVCSPFPPVEIPKESLVQHVWKNTDKWDEIPVSTCATSGRNYTYGLAKHAINKLAQALLAHCKLQPGDVVALVLPNIPENIIISHGISSAGLILTLANPLYKEDELKRQLQNSNVKAIVTISLLLDVILRVSAQLPNYKTTICVGGEDDAIKNVHSLQNLIMENHTSDLPEVSPKDVALIPYSSGTSGLPKGVLLTHQNLVANLVQTFHPELCEPRPEEINKKALTVLPYFHIYGFNSIMNTSAKIGITVVSIPKFTPEDYIRALLEHRPHFLFVVPSLLLFLAASPSVTKNHLASVEVITSGAAPATEGLLQKFREKVGRDVTITQGYGMTETSPVTLVTPRNKLLETKKDTVGVLLPNTEAKVISLMDGTECGPHSPGELYVKGPQIMLGYLNNDEANKDIFTEDGWLRTGDVVYYDSDAYFYIIDRCKELIKVKGNQVSPTELENIILEIPDIADVAVVGIPDSLCGEIPRAFVVKKKDSNVTEDQIFTYVNSKVASHKQLLGGIKFIELIPRNPGGKIIRNELKILQ